ncbi:MAG: alkaline phosphatase family protein [Bacteroidetes bacterium]|nr:alkaline phosphatase family protein [Bacteroidota bacterium]
MKHLLPHKTILLLLFLFLCANSYSQTSKQKSQKPKLVIGIVVDQMSNDYLSRFVNKFSETGFKRLLSSGFYFKNSYYEYVPTVTAAGHTSIYTGTLPSLNGIISNEWYDRANNKIVYCADDKSVTAVGIDSPKEKMSPVNILSSTVTDELKKSDSNSKVLSISIKDRGSIFPGGHLGKSFWFNDASGKFITSSYYMNELPIWLNNFNNRNLNDFYLSQSWNTLYPIETYTESTADSVPWESLYKGIKSPVFPYDLPALRSKNPELLAYTPYGNSILKELALTVLENEKMGKGKSTDFLCVSFSFPDKVGHHFGPNSIELEDTYLRLDKDLTEIFDYIDKNIGMENTLIFLTSDHSAASAPGYLKSIGVEAGNINTKKLQDSIETYLGKKYGDDDYVVWIQNLQIYLNKKVLDAKNLSLENIENEICDYLKNYEGINETYTFAGIDKGIYSGENSKLIYNGFVKEKSGDVFMVLDSNWIWNMSRGTTHGSVYKYDRNVPLLWCGWNVKHGETDEYNSQCDIAPTVSEILNIPKPSKSVGKSLKKILMK